MRVPELRHILVFSSLGVSLVARDGGLYLSVSIGLNGCSHSGASSGGQLIRKVMLRVTFTTSGSHSNCRGHPTGAGSVYAELRPVHGLLVCSPCAQLTSKMPSRTP